MKMLFCAFWLMSSLVVSAQQTLKLTYPNGSEQLVAGTDVEIRWEGVSPQDTVVLEYSVDSAKTWNNITTKATGLNYSWRVPNVISKQCLVRVQTLSTDEQVSNDWAKVVNGLNDDHAYETARDNEGNIYMCGNFNSEKLDFGNGIVLTNLSKNHQDFFVAKYDKYGTIRWARSGNSSEFTYVPSIVCDIFGDIIICGSFNSKELNFSNNVRLSTSGGTDLFVAKYDSFGNILWARNYGGVNNQGATSMTSDSEGNIIVGGSCTGFDFGNGVTLETSGNSNSYIAKFNENGDILWAHNTYGTLDDYTSHVITDKDNNIYTSGYFTSPLLKFTSSIELVNMGSGNSFLAKYNSSGDIIWVKGIGGTEYHDFIKSIVVDSESTSLYIGGSFTSPTLEFANDLKLKNSTQSYYSDGFIAKYSVNGNAIWAKNIGGIFTENVYTIDCNQQGDLYVMGTFTTSLDLGNNVRLPDANSYDDTFIIKYNEMGIAQTARLLQSKKTNGRIGFVRGTSIHSYSRELIVCGFFTSLSLVINNNIVLNASSKPSEIFIANLGIDSETIQSDTSNATFSIVKPEATSLDINMGQVLLSFSKDSTIKSFIRNTGNYPIRIDSLTLTGSNASDFQISPEKLPFTIEVGDEQQIECSFIPKSGGVRTAGIIIFTQADTLYQKITGEGIYPVIKIQTDIVDFGNVEVDNAKDSIVTAIFRNTGLGDAYFTTSQLIGADKDRFEIISGGSDFVIQPDMEHSIQLRFKPTYVGSMASQINFEYNSIDGQPAIVQLLGRGVEKELLKATVFIPDVSAFSGEKSAITLKLQDGSSIAIAQQKPTAFKAAIAYHKSILSPFKKITNASVLKGMEIDTLSISADWNGTSTTLAAIPFTATLGDRTETPLELLSFHWLNDAGEVINYDTELQSGVFTILGICGEGGTRLYDANGTAQMMMLAPHPATGIVEITFETIERGATKLVLTDVLGQQIVLKEGSFEKGSHSFAFDASGLADGMYILTMQTPTQVFTQQVIIGK